MRARSAKRPAEGNEQQRCRPHSRWTIAALIVAASSLAAACAAGTTPKTSDRTNASTPEPPLVVTPLDAGREASSAPPPRRWLEVAFFDALGAVVYRESFDAVRVCFERAVRGGAPGESSTPERGHAMLVWASDAGTAWSVEDSAGLSEKTLVCLKEAAKENDPHFERPARVYVVFR